MKNKTHNRIIKVLLVMMILVKSVLIPTAAKAKKHEVQAPIASQNSILVPVKFINSTPDALSKELEFEVQETITLNNKTQFKKGSHGVLQIKQIKKAGLFGRGGKIKFDSGSLKDAESKVHQIVFNKQYKGKSNNGALILGSTGIGAAAVLIPVGGLMMSSTAEMGMAAAIAPLIFIPLIAGGALVLLIGSTFANKKGQAYTLPNDVVMLEALI